MIKKHLNEEHSGYIWFDYVGCAHFDRLDNVNYNDDAYSFVSHSSLTQHWSSDSISQRVLNCKYCTLFAFIDVWIYYLAGTIQMVNYSLSRVPRNIPRNKYIVSNVEIYRNWHSNYFYLINLVCNTILKNKAFK